MVRLGGSPLLLFTQPHPQRKNLTLYRSDDVAACHWLFDAFPWKGPTAHPGNLQVLHSERVQQAAQQRGWAMSNLVATISHLMLGQLGAAFHLWVYSSLGVREAEGEAGR